MKSVWLFIITAFASFNAQAVTSAELKLCVRDSQQLLSDFDHGQAYLFKGEDLYLIGLPAGEKTKSSLFQISLAIFPSEKQNCFSFLQGRVAFESMTIEENRACHMKGRKIASAERAEGRRLDNAVITVLQQWDQETSETLSALADSDPTNQSFGRVKLSELESAFEGCKAMTGLSPAAEKLMADSRTTFLQMRALADRLSERTSSRAPAKSKAAH